MRVAIGQIDSFLSRDNLQKHLDIIKNTDADLIIFPELSLNGYLLQDKLFEDAYLIDELEEIQNASYNIDIVVGAALKDNDLIYNAGLYFSKGQLLHIHKKNHLPNYGMFEEARFFSRSNTIDGFKTNYGIGVILVCEDLWNGNTISRLAKIMPDFVLVISNSPARDFQEDGLLIQQQWEALLKSAALLAKSNIIFVNRIGFEDGIGFWGGSMVISAKAEILHKMPFFDEKIDIVKINQQKYKVQKMIFKHDE